MEDTCKSCLTLLLLEWTYRKPSSFSVHQKQKVQTRTMARFEQAKPCENLSPLSIYHRTSFQQYLYAIDSLVHWIERNFLGLTCWPPRSYVISNAPNSLPLIIRLLDRLVQPIVHRSIFDEDLLFSYKKCFCTGFAGIKECSWLGLEFAT